MAKWLILLVCWPCFGRVAIIGSGFGSDGLVLTQHNPHISRIGTHDQRIADILGGDPLSVRVLPLSPASGVVIDAAFDAAEREGCTWVLCAFRPDFDYVVPQRWRNHTVWTAGNEIRHRHRAGVEVGGLVGGSRIGSWPARRVVFMEGDGSSFAAPLYLRWLLEGRLSVGKVRGVRVGWYNCSGVVRGRWMRVVCPADGWIRFGGSRFAVRAGKNKLEVPEGVWNVVFEEAVSNALSGNNDR